jgi:hypothetical protein
MGNGRREVDGRGGCRWRFGGTGGGSSSLKLGEDLGVLKVARDAVLDAVAAPRMNLVALSRMLSVG